MQLIKLSDCYYDSQVFPQERETGVHKKKRKERERKQTKGKQLLIKFFKKKGEHNSTTDTGKEWFKLILAVV